MPYAMDNIPDAIKGLPKHAQEIFIAAFNSAYEQYKGDEEKCNATAWAAVKTKYEQDSSGGWHLKSSSFFEPPDSGDAPEGVKKILAEVYSNCRSAWVKEHPDDKENTDNKESCSRIAWDAVKKAGWSKSQDGKWIEKKDSGQAGMINYSELDWIPVFRTGTHTDSNGNTRIWGENDLDSIVSKYDPSHHEAPIVIGHPKDNSPAWGWIESLKREGDILLAKPKNLINEFVDMLKKGMFKKRSISIYPDGTLRHIGFLGAIPPSVKGLPDINFKGGEKYTSIEFEENLQANRKEAKIMKFFEWLKSLAQKEGVQLEDLPATFSEADLKTAAEKAAKEEREKAAAEFTEAQKKKDTEYAEREKKLKDAEVAAKKKAISDFCEGLKKKGILIPAMEKLGMGITSFMEQIATIETTIEFGEDGKKEKQTPLKFMQSFLTHLPKAIEFREVAGNDKDMKTGNAGEKIEALVKEKMKANKEFTYGMAFAEVQKENIDLAQEYAEELKGGK